MRQPQAGAAGPWPPQPDIRMVSRHPGMQVIALVPSASGLMVV